MFSILFADNNGVSIEIIEYYTVISELNSELINVSKNKNIIFFNAIPLSQVAKFLGIFIDDKFKWNTHIAYMKNNDYLKCKELWLLYNKLLYILMLFTELKFGVIPLINIQPISKLLEWSF